MKRWVLFALCICSVVVKAQGLWQSKDLSAINLKDIHGKSHSISPLSTGKTARCIIFLSPECPLCIKYTQRMRELQAKFEPLGIEFLYLFPGKYYSNETIERYLTKYGLTAPALLDPDFALTHALGATITPEVFVLSRSNLVVYSGKIDNWFEDFGKKRTVVTEHYLSNALEATINGSLVAIPKTKALGCFISP